MTDRQPIRVSGVKYSKPVGKALDRAPDGGIVKTPLLAERANAGVAINEAFATAAEAFDYRLAADATTMFVAGTFADTIKTVDEYIVVPKDRRGEAQDHLDGADGHFVISASGKAPNKFLEFRPGAGELRIDIDHKEPHEVAALYPSEPTRLKAPEEVRAAVLEVLPEAAGRPMLITPSSGSMIVDVATGELVKGPGGWRVIVPVDDATAIPRVLDTIETRCWAREKFHFAFIDKGASFQVRSLADQALGRPTQPDYPIAHFKEGSGLARDPRAVARFDVEGPYLAAASVVLSEDDRAAALAKFAEVEVILKPAKARQKRRATKLETERLVTKGVPRQAAIRAAEKKFEAGVLLGSGFISFPDDGGEVAAGVLLSPEGEKYDGRICFDPVEPDYDGWRPVGKIYWNDGLRPGVHSFAHGSKFWKIAHDAESAAAALDAADGDRDAVVHVLAVADVDSLDRDRLETKAAGQLGLGIKRKPLRIAVDERRHRIAALAREAAGDADVGETAYGGSPPLPGPTALDTPLARWSFPHTELMVSGKIKVLDHMDNIAHMLASYGIGHKYNVVTKSIECRHTEIKTDGDNAETAVLSQMLSLCALNDVPILNLSTHMTALADRDAYNPVVGHLAALKWDGKPRFDALVDATEPADREIARIVMRLFLLQACAAADSAEAARKINPEYLVSFEGCLVFVGDQGLGKTKGLRKLLPRALRRHFKEGLTLALGEKDSVTSAVSCWLAELGELDATFRKSDIAGLKSFLSRDVDEIRAPYARKRSNFARRTAFTGTVNDVSFLADETGNRRFWPLTVGKVDVGWSDGELEQLWAEAWTRYAAGEKWWPSADEELSLAANAEEYRYRSPVEEAIEDHYQWGRRPEWNSGRKTASEIFAEVSHRPGVGALTPSAVKTIGATLSRLWRASGLVERRGGVLVIADKAGDRMRANASGGKNRGWLLPPPKSARLMRSGLALLDGDKTEEQD